ncbi:Sensory transduction protein LytR [termite gut metagenome]|uniref:Sensory transduction protein LytR n=1 Tax=termite gut metagenome TaxID=433724 RepID=A0A5J4SQR8_9ZZZZ
MKILIVEDETAAYENLKNIIEEINPSIQISGHTESVVQTARWLSGNPAPDLIFMDIHLSDGSAFNIFAAVTVETPVIFTTAYNEYAIEAFKINSIDYLLKPIVAQEVERALEKYHKLNNKERLASLNNLLLSAEKYPDKMLIPVNNKLVPVDIAAISYFYSSNGNSRVVLKDNTCFHYVKPLDAIYNLLSPSLFFRANKQFIISKDSVRNITIWFDSRLFVTLDTDVPERLYVSKNKASLFKKWLTAG